MASNPYLDAMRALDAPDVVPDDGGNPYLRTMQQMDRQVADRDAFLVRAFADTEGLDRRGAILDLVGKTRLPSDVVERNFDRIRSSWDASQRDVAAWRRANPELADLITLHPTLAPIVEKPDNAGWIERQFRAAGAWNKMLLLEREQEGPWFIPGKPGPVTRWYEDLISSMGFDPPLQTTRAKEVEKFHRATGDLPPEQREFVEDARAREVREGGIAAQSLASFEEGLKQSEINEVGFKLMLASITGGETWDLEKQLADLRNEALPRDFGGGELSKFVQTGMGVSASTVEMVKTGGVAAGAGALAGGAITRSAAGARTGAKIGFTWGATGAAFEQETAQAWLQIRETKTDDGQPIPNEIAVGAAVAYGLLAAGVERWSFGAAAQSWGPVAEAFYRGEGVGALVRAAKDAGFAATLGRMAQGFAKRTRDEGAEEFVQRVLNDVSEWGAKTATAGQVQAFDAGAAFLGGAGEAYAAVASTLTGGGMQSAAAATATYGLTRLQRMDAAELASMAAKETGEQRSAATIEDITQLAQGELAQQSHEVAAEYVRKVTAARGEEVTHVYVEPALLFRWYQDANRDPADALGSALHEAARVATAVGEKVEVPVVEYLRLLQDPIIGKDLPKHVSTRPSYGSFAEQQEAAKQVDARTKELIEGYDKETEKSVRNPAERRLIEALQADLVRAGVYDEKEAKHAVNLVRAGLRTLAERAGMKPERVYDLFRLKVERDRDSDAVPEGGPGSTVLTELAGAAAAPRAPATEPITPKIPQRPGQVRFGGDPPAGGKPGPITRVVTPQRPEGERARYQVLEVDDLIPSHSEDTFTPNPAYPEGVQEREYHSQPEEQAKVVMGAQKLDPALLLTDTPTAVDGPPLVTAGARALVLGGNARSMMLRRGLRDEATRERYRAELLRRAPGLGLDPEAIARMRAPVLVRVLEEVDADAPAADLVAAVRRTNEGLTQALSPRARAVAEARTMSPETIAAIAELLAQDDDSTLRDVMRERPRDLVAILRRDGILTAQNQSSWLAGNELTDEAKDRIEGMFLGRVVGSGDRFAQTAPSILAKLERVTPALLRVAGLNPAMDQIPTVRAALDLLNDGAARGLSIDQLVNQRGLFEDVSHAPETVSMARLLSTAKPKEVEARLKAWASIAAVDPRQVDMFRGPPTPEEGRKALFGETFFQAAFHGSPHRFDRFSLHAIGTGEGAQAYGWGLYFAGRRDIAEHYRKTLTRSAVHFDGREPKTEVEQAVSYLIAPEIARGRDMAGSLAIVAKVLQQRAEDMEAKLDDVRSRVGVKREGWGNLTHTDADVRMVEAKVQESRAAADFAAALTPERVTVNRGQLYKVEIPDDEDLLDYWKPALQQTEKIQAIAREVMEFFKQDPDRAGYSGPTGADLYDDLQEMLRRQGKTGGRLSPRAASLWLLERGVPGLRYPDSDSRRPKRTLLFDGKPISTDDFEKLSDGVQAAISSNDAAEIRRTQALRDALNAIDQVAASRDVEDVAHLVALAKVYGGPNTPAHFQAAVEELGARLTIEQEKQTFNYVIWDDSRVSIAETFYQSGRPARLDPARVIEVAVVPSGVFEGLPSDKTGQPTMSAVSRWARDNVAGRYLNESTGWEIRVTGRGINESIHDGDYEDRLSLPALPELLRRAVLADTEPHRHGTANKQLMHTLFAAVELDGVLHRARLLVEEGKQGRDFYHLRAVELEKRPASHQERGKTGPKPPHSHSVTPGPITLGALLEGVNRADGTPVLADPERLEQAGEGPRAFVEIMRGAQAETVYRVVLNKSADRSSFLHEVGGHVFFSMMSQLATLPEASQQLRDDLAAALEWMGVGSVAEMKVEHHEQWARGFEAYLMEGRAPSKRLRSAFRSFARWMKQVYQTLLGLNVELSDDIRGVFDRLLATDAEIEAAARDMGLDVGPAPADVLSPEEVAAYHKERAEAVERAREVTAKTVLGDRVRQHEDWWKAEERRQREIAEGEYDQLPAAKAKQFLTGQIQVDGEPVEGPAGRLDRAAVIALVGELRARSFRTAKTGGLRPDDVAQMFGYPDGLALLEALESLPEKKDWVRRTALERMERLYPDLLKERDALRLEAVRNLHSKRTATSIGMVLGNLRRRAALAGEAPPEAIERAGRAIAERQNLHDLERNVHLKAQRKAAKRAERAVERGNWKTAAALVQQQLLNFHAHQRTLELREEMKQARAYIAKRRTPEYEADLAKASPAYHLLWRAIRAATGLAPPLEGTPTLMAEIQEAITEVQRLAEGAASPLEFEPDALRVLLTNRPAWEGMTLAEARLARNAMLNIRSHAMAANHVRIAGEKEALAKFVGRLVEGMKALPNLGAQKPGAGAPQLGRKRDWIVGFHGKLIDPELLFERLGPAGKELFQRYLDRKTFKHEMVEKVLSTWIDLTQRMPKDLMETRHDIVPGLEKDLPFPADVNLDQQEPRTYLWLMMVALNAGNDSNLQRLTGGFGWTEKQLFEALDKHLTKAHWDFIQSIWDVFDKDLWPHVAEKERRKNGVPPEKIKPRAIVTRHGTYAGGYFPARYDPFASVGDIGERQALDSIASLYEPPYRRAHVPHSHVKQRADQYRNVLLLQWNVVPQHVAQVIHDLAFDEFVRDAGRIIFHPEVRTALYRHLGKNRANDLREWLRAVANGQSSMNVDAAREVVQGLGLLRARMVAAAIGQSLTVAAADFTNAGVAAALGSRRGGTSVRFGVPAWAAALPFTGYHAGLRKMALEKSAELRNRVRAHENDKRLLYLKRIGQEQGRFDRTMEDLANANWFFFIQTDKMASTQIWLARYWEEKSNDVDEATAIARADEAVRASLPSPEITEKPALLRSEQAATVLAFFSYFSKMYNLLYGRLAGSAVLDATAAKREGTAAAYGEAALRAVEVAFRSLAVVFWVSMGDLFSGRGPDPDEDWHEWLLRKSLVAYLAPVPGFITAEPLINGLVTGEVQSIFDISPRAAPAFSAIGSIGKSLLRVSQEGVEPRDAVLTAAELFAFRYKLPVSQPRRSLGYLESLVMGDTEAQGVGDVVSGLVYGERENQSLNPITAVREWAE